MKPRTAAEVLPFLPMAVRNRVEELSRVLQQELLTDLHALILHGSAVRGHYVVGVSDVNLLVVVRDDRPARLERIGAALRVARAAARIECTILRDDEISRAADVFPLLFADVKDCHAVLHGADPFVDLIVHDEHRRLRVEQELRDARIALRRLVAEDGLTGAALVEPVTRTLKRLRSPLAALLDLNRGAVKDGIHHDLDKVVHGCAALLKVDAAPLFSPARDPHGTLLALRALLDAAVQNIDALGADR